MLLSTFGSGLTREDRAAPVRNDRTAPSQGQGPIGPAELEAFLDELLAKEMEENHIAGAAVSVVKDGELLFAKGYDYADLEAGLSARRCPGLLGLQCNPELLDPAGWAVRVDERFKLFIAGQSKVAD
jgi:hypothetical protein